MKVKKIKEFAGQSRPVIDFVSPRIEGERLPIKRIIGDSIFMTAHVIADGHDQIDVCVGYRLKGKKAWTERVLQDHGNDEFYGEFKPEEIGLFEYVVKSWIDPFHNWHVGFIKKSDNQDPKIDVELAICVDFLKSTVNRAKGNDKKLITNWLKFLEDEERDLQQRIQTVRDPEFYDTMRRYPDRSYETTSSVFYLLVERKKAIFSTWYEYFPRSCADDEAIHGSFKDAEGRLEEIAKMGFNVVYFPPIHPIGRKYRKGRNNSLTPDETDVGSPWAIGAKEGGHKSIHSELGTLKDFQAFMKAASDKGLEVAMDIAFQCAPDHPYVKEHPDWFMWRPDGTVQYAENPPKKYQDILPFDFETDDWENLWHELKSIFIYWIEVGVKIFRVDNPHTKPLPFWHWCILEIKEQYPEVLFLAEAFTRPKRKYRLAKAGFTQGYTYFTWRNFAQEMREYVEELALTDVKQFFYPNFWPNTPDILHEDLQKGNRTTFIGRYVLAATLSSNIGIYGPAYEVLDREPFPGKEEYNNNEKYQLKKWDWNSAGNIKNEIELINSIRNTHPALQRFENIKFVDTDNPSLIAYLKQTIDGSDRLLVVVNMDWNHPQQGHVFLPLNELGVGSDKEILLTDLFDLSNPSYRWRGSKNYVKLEPHKTPAHIFQIKV